MSRGLGRIEREILSVVSNASEVERLSGIALQDVADRIASGSGKSPSPALAAAVRRAAGSLDRKELIWKYRNGRSAYVMPPPPGMASDVAAPPNKNRDKLVKLLGMLGSAHEGERANAAQLLEKERVKLGLTWAQILGTE